MPRIQVTSGRDRRGDAPVMLDEHVLAMHLRDGHAAEQLIERLGWALSDAEELEAKAPQRPPGGG